MPSFKLLYAGSALVLSTQCLVFLAYGLLQSGTALNESSSQSTTGMHTTQQNALLSSVPNAVDSTYASVSSTHVTTLTKPVPWNPTVLAISWAGDFLPIAKNQIDVKTNQLLTVHAKGDGITDDTAAVRAAIHLASSNGGGTVYFPPGDYKVVTPSGDVSGSPLLVPSRVILRGASSATSHILLNDSQASSKTIGNWTWGGIDFYGSSLSGMTDLAVTAVSPSSSPCATIWNTGSAGVHELFFNNLKIDLSNCRPLWLNGVNKLLLKNSNIHSVEDNPQADQVGPVYLVGNTNVSVVGNTFTYNFGRLQLWNDSSVLIQGNTLTRDAHNRDMENGTAIESGGIQISFDSNIQVLANTIRTVNAPFGEAADGEAIMSQLGTTADVIDAGSSTAVTSNTLTDLKSSWGPITVSRLARYPDTVVAILSGSATGEVRTIQSFDTNTKTLTLKQPWNSIPEVGSLYSIFRWTLTNAKIQANSLVGNPNGIELYDGCNNCTMQNNILTDSRGILLRTVDRSVSSSTYPETRRIHEVAVNNRISNNTVSNTLGIRPAYIALDVEAFGPDGYLGIGMMNVRIGRNVVSPYSANPNKTYVSGASELTMEGLLPCYLYGPAPIKAPITTVFQNIRFWSNTLSTPVTYSSSFTPFATRACVTPSAPAQSLLLDLTSHHRQNTLECKRR